MAGSLPALPVRKKIGGSGSSQTRPKAAVDVEALRDIAASVKGSAAFERIMSQPDLLSQALQSNPQLYSALQSSPQLAQLLSADGISRLLDAVQSSDAEAALQGLVSGQAGDLAQQRKLLIQLQSYAAQLKMTMPEPRQRQQQQQQQQQEGGGGGGGGAQQQQLMMMHLQQRMSKMSGMLAAFPGAPVGPMPGMPGMPWQQQRQQSQQHGAQLPVSFPAGWAMPQAPSPDVPAGSSFSSWAGGEQRAPGSSFGNWLEPSQQAPHSPHKHGPGCSHQRSGGGGGEGDPLLPAAPSARTHYESVPPSKWRPEHDPDSEPYTELYRRAYCSHGDAVFMPLWFAAMASLAVAGELSFWALLVAGVVTFFCGLYLVVVRWAGVPSHRLQVSRVVSSFLVTYEVTCLLVYLRTVAPAGPLWRGDALAMLCAFAALFAAHYTASTSDPGFVELPRGGRQGGEDEEGAEEERPVQLDECGTCKVPRQLRSKHCPLCKRCVLHFDHHCPFINNCVGQGNQRIFLLFLAAALVAQLLFISQAFSLICTSAAAAAPHAAGLFGLLRRVYLASVLHPGLLLFALVQVLLGGALAFLLLRGLLAAAANLTVNEFVNRERYLHLKHETAGFCNRFDLGPAANCRQFWFEPVQDWWHVFEKNDQAMNARGKTLLVDHSLTLLIRVFDKQWAEHKAALMEARQRRKQRAEQQRLQTALQGLGLDGSRAAAKAAAAAGTQGGSGSGSGGCTRAGCKSCASHV